MADHQTPLETRIIELETRIAYQERMIETLDEVVRDFSARVESLERTIRHMQSAVAAEPGAAVEPPPPHY